MTTRATTKTQPSSNDHQATTPTARPHASPSCGSHGRAPTRSSGQTALNPRTELVRPSPADHTPHAAPVRREHSHAHQAQRFRRRAAPRHPQGPSHASQHPRRAARVLDVPPPLPYAPQPASTCRHHTRRPHAAPTPLDVPQRRPDVPAPPTLRLDTRGAPAARPASQRCAAPSPDAIRPLGVPPAPFSTRPAHSRRAPPILDVPRPP